MNITEMCNKIEERCPGLSTAIVGLHTFTCTDYTAAFHRKGKVKALKLVADNDDARWVESFNTLCAMVLMLTKNLLKHLFVSCMASGTAKT